MGSIHEATTTEEAAEAAVAAALAEEEARAEYGAWLEAHPAPLIGPDGIFGSEAGAWLSEAEVVWRRRVEAGLHAEDARRALVERVEAEAPVDLHSFTLALVEMVAEVDGVRYSVMVCATFGEVVIVAGD